MTHICRCPSPLRLTARTPCKRLGNGTNCVQTGGYVSAYILMERLSLMHQMPPKHLGPPTPCSITFGLNLGDGIKELPMAMWNILQLLPLRFARVVGWPLWGPYNYPDDGWMPELWRLDDQGGALQNKKRMEIFPCDTPAVLHGCAVNWEQGVVLIVERVWVTAVMELPSSPCFGKGIVKVKVQNTVCMLSEPLNCS